MIEQMFQMTYAPLPEENAAYAEKCEDTSFTIKIEDGN